jgi:hypothetical protein
VCSEHSSRHDPLTTFYFPIPNPGRILFFSLRPEYTLSTNILIMHLIHRSPLIIRIHPGHCTDARDPHTHTHTSSYYPYLKDNINKIHLEKYSRRHPHFQLPPLYNDNLFDRYPPSRFPDTQASPLL